MKLLLSINVMACASQARTGQEGATVLYVACATKNMVVVGCLLRLTASEALVNAVNDRGQTPLDCAQGPSTLLLWSV